MLDPDLIRDHPGPQGGQVLAGQPPAHEASPQHWSQLSSWSSPSPGLPSWPADVRHTKHHIWPEGPAASASPAAGQLVPIWTSPAASCDQQVHWVQPRVQPTVVTTVSVVTTCGQTWYSGTSNLVTTQAGEVRLYMFRIHSSKGRVSQLPWWFSRSWWSWQWQFTYTSNLHLVSPPLFPNPKQISSKPSGD